MWAAGAGCPGGAGARVDAIGAGDAPAPPSAPRSRAGGQLGPLGALTAAAGPRGQIVIAGTDPGRPGEALLIQGLAGGPFAPLLKGGPTLTPGALSTAYLGDVALAAPARRGGVAGGVLVRVERHFADALGPATQATSRTAPPVAALTVAMDYRSDALATWAQGGDVYVRDLPASGTHHTLQRLGPAGSQPRIAALLSDDNRGIVMWSDRHGPITDLYMDYSATRLRFGAPRLLERVRDPGGLPPPAGSPQLIRLSSESVMAARGIDTAPGRTVFGAPEQIAPAGPLAGAAVAIDPDSDRAVAAWRGQDGSILYSIRSPDAAG